MLVRHADPARDGAACAAIWAPHVVHGAATAGVAVDDASVGLRRALGVEHVGVHRRVGWKFGAWRDVSWRRLQLAAGYGDRPREALAPQRL